MKTKLIFLFFTFISLSVSAQISFQEHIITDGIENVTKLFPADLDGDGDMDVLAASSNGGLSWFENTDGLGDFGIQHNISTAMKYFVYAADIDNDGDMDVVSGDDNQIDWYENMDGQGTYGPAILIYQLSPELYFGSVCVVDLDGDGDMDILYNYDIDYASTYFLQWCENTDGQESFGCPSNYFTIAGHRHAIHTSDINGDGAIDIVVDGVEAIAWFENLGGQSNFGPLQFIGYGDSPCNVFSADIDDDGDMDLLSYDDDDKLNWHENTDGQGIFNQHQISTDYARSIRAVDMDQDGDMDVISGSSSTILWYENLDGQGSFSVQQIISDNDYGYSYIYAADINNDNKIDVLAAFPDEDKIAWYENLRVIGVQEIPLLSLSIFPNPTTSVLEIQSKKIAATVQIFNQLGQLVIEKVDTKQINISSLTQGIYFCKITTKNGNFETKKIIKE